MAIKFLRLKQVALLIETSRAYGRGLLTGVANYIRDNGPWTISRQEQKTQDGIPEWMEAWRGDGIIARIGNPNGIRWLRKLKVPLVELHDAPPSGEFPCVLTNDEAVAAMAFEHFRERGFRHFAFSGFNGAYYSDVRREAFQQLVGKNGMRCHIYRNAWELGLVRSSKSTYHGLNTLSAGYLGEKNRELAVRWVQQLPKPVGLFACNDVRGQQMLDICQAAGITVPDEVAVLGSNNDEVLCDLANPTLSSIVPNSKRIGYQAAALLDQMMSGEKVPPRPIFVEPLGIVARRSTEVLAIDNRHVAMAVNFIRGHACSGATVKDAAKAAGLSERTMERQFIKILGHSPKEEILRVRLNRAKQLLAETDFSLAWIAEKIGLEHTEYISRIFKKKIGITPGAFRARAQSAMAADKLLR